VNYMSDLDGYELTAGEWDVTLKWIDDAGVAHTRSEMYPKAVIRYGSYRRNT
jgi:hypothetical protein